MAAIWPGLTYRPPNNTIVISLINTFGISYHSTSVFLNKNLGIKIPLNGGLCSLESLLNTLFQIMLWNVMKHHNTTSNININFHRHEFSYLDVYLSYCQKSIQACIQPLLYNLIQKVINLIFICSHQWLNFVLKLVLLVNIKKETLNQIFFVKYTVRGYCVKTFKYIMLLNSLHKLSYHLYLLLWL